MFSLLYHMPNYSGKTSVTHTVTNHNICYYFTNPYRIEHDGSGLAPGWHLDRVSIKTWS